jgi:hypothetical protein
MAVAALSKGRNVLDHLLWAWINGSVLLCCPVGRGQRRHLTDLLFYNSDSKQVRELNP